MQQGKFVVALTFDGCRNIRKFCTDEHTPYWLSWNIYGKTYQSDSFIPGEGGELPRFRDTVHVQCNANEDGTVPTQLCHGFPLRVFLCTNELVVAVAVVDPFDQNEAVPKTPLQFNAWLDLHPVAESAAPVGSSFLNVGVLILPEGSGAHPAEEGREDLSGEHSENGYEDDDFEDAGVAGPPPPPPPPIQSDTPTDKQQKNNNSFDDEADKMLRHFRVSVDVRSIGGLKRPAHVSVQFMYPFLGASSPVRSTPLWIQAYTEAKIDGAVASYECAMTRERITDILKTHPLRIAALSKSHLGNNILGEIHVDLAAANNTDPHSYRCPLTSRMFKTREDYSKHRQMMMSLMAAGRIDRAPARDPVVVRVVDAYLAVTPPAKGATTVDPSKSLNVYTGGVVQGDNTAKVRVVTIIEDIGAVGPETAITVRPGYKMHNGAVYQIDDDAIQLSAAADGNAPPSDPLARTDITPEQRAALNKLKLEWEAWRRATEAQWREAMYEKEAAMRKKVEQDGVEALADKADNLKRATEESNKLEVRLRMAIDAAERQKNTLALREEQMQVKLAQKTNELQLLQRRVRDEAKALVEGEKNKAEALSRQLAAVQESLKVAERRAKISEDDFEAYRLRMRGTPEAVLREENAKLRAQLGAKPSHFSYSERYWWFYVYTTIQYNTIQLILILLNIYFPCSSFVFVL